MSIQQQKTDVHQSPGGVDLRHNYYIILFVVVGELPECLIQLASIAMLATFQAPYTYISIACTSTNCHQGHLTRGYTLSYQKRKAIPTSAALIMNQRY